MRKHIIYIITLVILCMGTGAYAQASHPSRIPAKRDPIERVQPNGEKVTILLRGDERSHYSMTTDGWQVKEGKDGYIYYAIQKKDGSIAAGKRIAHNAPDRSKCEARWLRRKGIKPNKQD